MYIPRDKLWSLTEVQLRILSQMFVCLNRFEYFFIILDPRLVQIGDFTANKHYIKTQDNKGFTNQIV